MTAASAAMLVVANKALRRAGDIQVMMVTIPCYSGPVAAIRSKEPAARASAPREPASAVMPTPEVKMQSCF
jgi:hypothetical protein